VRASRGLGGRLVREARGRPMAHAVLELIWHSDGITRAGIARSTGLARSTVSEIVGDLLETDLVVEAEEAPSGGGRRAVMLRFAAAARVVLGLDIGAAHVSVVLTDMAGNELFWHDEPFGAQGDPDGTMRLVGRVVTRGLSEVAGDTPLLGIGVGLPAPIDHSTPRAPAASVLPAWDGHSGLRDLAARLHVPLELENDANLGALAELWWGSTDGIRDFTFLKVATGVGAGHIVRGEIFGGASGVAGEIGHVTIDPEGEMCVCGNRGCLTTLVGTQALLQRAERGRMCSPDSVLATGELSVERLVDAADQGDPLALEIVEEAGTYLGDAIASLVNLMNPGEVVLGGGLSRAGDRLLDAVRRVVASRTLVASVLSTQIRASTLGERDVALGAATLVIAAALERPDRYFREVAAL